MRLGIASGDRVLAKNSRDGNPHWGGAGWVRLGQYIPHLAQHGIKVWLGTLVWNRNRFCIDDSGSMDGLKDVDVIYMQRLMHDSLAEHIKLARRSGQIIINDLDDWYWGLHPSNAAFASSHPKNNPGENVNHYKSVLNASTVVTVSTPYLADRIKKFVHCPIELMYNTVDVGRFKPLEHTSSDVPVVGWVGSTSHRSSDLEQLSGIVKPLFETGDIKLQHSGAHEGAETLAHKWGLNDEDVFTIPAVEAELYPSLLTMDVGIAPLSDMPFNHAKSDIKLLEYSAGGIPWVASDLPSYRSLHEKWGLGRIAKKPTHWAKHLKELKNPNTRAEEGSALREAVWQRDIGVGASIMIEFLESLS